MENLDNILESLLFVAGEAVAISDITAKLDVTKNEIEKAAKRLQEKYGEKCGINLLTFNGKLQFSSNPKFAEQVSTVLNPIRQRNLTKATMETASIIAYKQPITRMEIEEIRGVGCDYAINVLLEHKLIEVVGRKDTVGHPALFGTTDEFLKRFDISSIDELPDYQQMIEDIKKINEKPTDDSLYNNFKVEEQTEEEVEQKLTEIAKDDLTDHIEEETDDFVDSNLEQFDDDDLV
ncbi:MAG: SMC-Scp complex subunit ScpB [Clostridia bacterium]|nr:SMC-Scp complex subunit ScpB [Clostridia bacterium]